MLNELDVVVPALKVTVRTTAGASPFGPERSRRAGSDEVSLTASALAVAEGSVNAKAFCRSLPTVNAELKPTRAGRTFSHCCRRESGSANPLGTLKLSNAQPAPCRWDSKVCLA